MEPNIQRLKLLNAVLFFAKKIKRPTLTKICKLLYFLDFTHFKQTGYPSIGLQYSAARKGPLPMDFWSQVTGGEVPDDFVGKLELEVKTKKDDPKYKEVLFTAKKKPDLSLFSPREQKLLEDLAFVFHDVTAQQMSEISYLKNQPWDKTRNEKGEWAMIDYMLAIDNEAAVDSDEAKESLKEFFEVLDNFCLRPAG